MPSRRINTSHSQSPKKCQLKIVEKREEEQADCNEDDPRAAESLHECRLSERGAVLSCAHNACCEDREYRQVRTINVSMNTLTIAQSP